MEYCIILTTTPNRALADNIANKLITENLAACVNVAPNVTSFYRWQNKIQKDEEFLLFIKTNKNNFEKVKETILKIHTYELPEIVQIPIEQGYDKYLEWINKETNADIN